MLVKNDRQAEDDSIRLELARKFVASVLPGWIAAYNWYRILPRHDEITKDTLVPTVYLDNICGAINQNFGTNLSAPPYTVTTGDFIKQAEYKDITFGQLMDHVKEQAFPQARETHWH